MFKNVATLEERGYTRDGDLLVLEDNGLCLDVYHIGRWPEVFRSCHYKNGQSWNIRYRGLAIQIPNPISFLKFQLGDLFSEVVYAVKSYLAVKSGLVRLASKRHEYDEWIWEDADLDYDDPYYICAEFENGRHIPVPILADWKPGEHRLQKWAIGLARGHAAIQVAEALGTPEEIYE